MYDMEPRNVRNAHSWRGCNRIRRRRKRRGRFKLRLLVLLLLLLRSHLRPHCLLPLP